MIIYYDINYITITMSLLPIITIACLTGLLSWITIYYGINQTVECSYDNSFDYCKKYVQSGIGKVISNDADPMVNYNLYGQSFNCNLHHVDVADYPIDYTFDVYYKRDEPIICVSEEYTNDYIRDETINAKNFSYIMLIWLFPLYGMILTLIYAKFIDSCIPRRSTNLNNTDIHNPLNNGP